MSMKNNFVTYGTLSLAVVAIVLAASPLLDDEIQFAEFDDTVVFVDDAPEATLMYECPSNTPYLYDVVYSSDNNYETVYDGFGYLIELPSGAPVGFELTVGTLGNSFDLSISYVCVNNSD